VSRALLDEARRAHADRRHGRAVMLLRRLVQARPALGEDWRTAAQLAAALLDSATAARAQRLYLEGGGAGLHARLELARLLHDAGWFEDARAEVETAYEAAPEDPDALHASAYIHAQLGDDALAIERYRAAALASPRHVAAWPVIMRMKRATADDPDLDRLRRADARLRAAGPAARAPLKYALGYAMEDLGEDAEAFAQIRDGARLMAEHSAYDPAPIARKINAHAALFSADRVARAKGVHSDRPIFVVGAPRAGTTLVESVLCAHSGVAGGGETPFLAIAGYPVQRAAEEGPAGFDAALAGALGGDPWRRVGATFMTLAEERHGEHGKFVDSSITLPWHVGIALCALPRARVVWMTRDRRDALWGIYRILFTSAQTFSYDFWSIRERLDRIDALRDHFAAIAAERILLVDYEDLARDPKTWIGRILDHCGLPPEDAALRFQGGARVVSSASAGQVREPVSDKRVGAWRRYRAQLDPIYRDILGANYDSGS